MHYATAILAILAVLLLAVSPEAGVFVGFAAVMVEASSRVAKRNGW